MACGTFSEEREGCSRFAAGTGAVLYDGGLGAAGELTQLSAGVSFVGNAGLNPALLQSVDSVSVDAVGGVPGHIGLIG